MRKLQTAPQRQPPKQAAEKFRFRIRVSLQRYRKFCFVSGYRFSDTASSVLYQAIASAIPQVLFCIRLSLQRYRKFFRIRRPFRGCPSVFAQPDGTKLFCIRLSLQRYRKFCFVSASLCSNTVFCFLYQLIASAIPQFLPNQPPFGGLSMERSGGIAEAIA